jgi:hypothetical protein
MLFSTCSHTAVAVAVTTTAAKAANTNRIGLLLVNDSDTTIYIKIGADAVLNQGIRLNANGGSFEMNAALGNLASGAVNAIHGGSSTKALLVTEWA